MAWGRFGADPAIIGRALVVNNLSLTVIGVAPPNFIGVNSIFGPDLWLPAAMAERLLPNEMSGALTDRSKTFFFGLGRLSQARRRTSLFQVTENAIPPSVLSQKIQQVGALTE